MITKAYKYKIYKQNANHQKRLEDLLRTAAWVYNHSHSVMRIYYRIYGKSISQARMQSHIAKMKHRCFPKWNDLDAQCTQQIIDRIYDGYKKFFNKTAKRPPQFKNWRRYSSITYKQSGYTLNGNVLSLNKQKLRLKFHLSRPIEGKIQTVCISRDAVGDWWVSFTVRKEEEQPTMPMTGKAVGMDFGMMHYLTLSDGKKIESPQYLKEALDELRKRSRELSRKEKGSNSRKRARLDVARLHRRVRNLRTNFHWELACRLAAEYDTICIEDLDIKAMQQEWGRKISDMAFSDFVRVLSVVCKKQGKQLVQIGRWEATSKTCSVCGHKADDMPLSMRKWMCPECGARHDRDEMGIDDEEDGEATVCGVIDIFNNGGCYFPYTMSVAVDERAFWQFYAFQCLYVVKEGDKMEVKAYALVNGGKTFDVEESEPDHDYLESYDLDIITKLYYWLIRNCGEKES